MRGSPNCAKHAGTGVRNVSPARLDARFLDRLKDNGLLPLDLCATPVWQGLNALGMATRAPLQRQLAMLWGHRETQSQAFTMIWRSAVEAIRNHAGAR